MILFGAILIVNGLMHTISYFSIKNEVRIFSFELVQGIISIIVGFVFVLNTQLVAAFLPFIVGAWVIIESIVKIQLAFNVRDVKNSYWVLMLILSLITATFGVVILLNPFASAIAITSLCGIMLFISELINLFEAAYLLFKLR